MDRRTTGQTDLQSNINTDACAAKQGMYFSFDCLNRKNMYENQILQLHRGEIDNDKI